MVDQHRFLIKAEDLPVDGSLVRDDGWHDMRIRWMVTDETVGATRHVLGIAVFAPGAKHDVHRHPNAEESYYVLKGHGVSRVGDEEIPTGTGEVVFVPENEWHGFANTSDGETTLLWTYAGAPSLEAAGYVRRDEGGS